MSLHVWRQYVLHLVIITWLIHQTHVQGTVRPFLLPLIKIVIILLLLQYASLLWRGIKNYCIFSYQSISPVSDSLMMYSTNSPANNFSSHTLSVSRMFSYGRLLISHNLGCISSVSHGVPVKFLHVKIWHSWSHSVLVSKEKCMIQEKWSCCSVTSTSASSRNSLIALVMKVSHASTFQPNPFRLLREMVNHEFDFFFAPNQTWLLGVIR